MEKILIWADGGCRGNGRVKNIGGWGVVLRCGNYEREMKGSVENTTNNIMELTSAIMALNTLKRIDLPVEVTMDSQYVVKGINEWSPGWIEKNWRGVKNVDLWQQLLKLVVQFHDIKFIWCAGHADDAGINRADALANVAMDELERAS